VMPWCSILRTHNSEVIFEHRCHPVLLLDAWELTRITHTYLHTGRLGEGERDCNNYAESIRFHHTKSSCPAIKYTALCTCDTWLS
jgi:hypothetical protein